MKRDTLVIVDDSELDLVILNEIFKTTFHVQCISNSKQAMSYIRQNKDRICAVFLDIYLWEKGRGIRLLQQLHDSTETENIPIILITSDANEEYVVDGMEKGATDFLVKPVDPHTVHDRVCKIVRNAWPLNTTILDEIGIQGQDTRIKPPHMIEEKEENFFSYDDIESFMVQYLKQLGVFGQFRLGVSLEQCKKISKITGMLVKNYIEHNPSSSLKIQDATLIEYAAHFYDIGFLGIPDYIIKGGASQEDPNRTMYFQHIELGKDFFESFDMEHPFFTYCQEITYWHHKNYDGSGYPITTGRIEVPLSAQFVITALKCDFYAESYVGAEDYYDKMLRALKREIGESISREMYENVVQAQGNMERLMNTIYGR